MTSMEILSPNQGMISTMYPFTTTKTILCTSWDTTLTTENMDF